MDSFVEAKRAAYLKELRGILKTIGSLDSSPRSREAARSLDHDLKSLQHRARQRARGRRS